MAAPKTAVAESQAVPEVELKHVAFWSDTSGGTQVQPGLKKFYTKQEVLNFLTGRVQMHEETYQYTGQPFKLESARVMREACVRLHRKLKATNDWKQFESAPLDLAGVVSAYADKHRRRTTDIQDPKPRENTDRQIPANLAFLEDESPATRGRGGSPIVQQPDLVPEATLDTEE